MNYENEVECFKHAGLTVRIVQDTDPRNPRTDQDNFGHMMCWHRNYILGDKHELPVEEGKELATKVDREGGIVLPLFLYDHSGVTMNTTGFSCPWDSGQVGFIYATKEDIRENWGVKNVTKKKL